MGGVGNGGLAVGYRAAADAVVIKLHIVFIGKQVDLANSIYIDWSSFINAVINFFLISFVLFTIVKIFNKIKEESNELNAKLKKEFLTKEERKELKARGVRLSDVEAIKAYRAEKEAAAKALAEAKAAAEAEAARIERENNPTTEDLLKSILAELKKGR